MVHLIQRILSVLPVGYHAKRDRKCQKTAMPHCEGSLMGPGLNYAGEGNSYVAFEVSSTLECGCCFDDECLFVSPLSYTVAYIADFPNGRSP
jgi:hypothetical protein